jgi:hypothetical protein
LGVTFQVNTSSAAIRPDFPELKEPFPFLWQQAEYVLTGAATYVFTVLAADRLLGETPSGGGGGAPH